MFIKGVIQRIHALGVFAWVLLIHLGLIVCGGFSFAPANVTTPKAVDTVEPIHAHAVDAKAVARTVHRIEREHLHVLQAQKSARKKAKQAKYARLQEEKKLKALKAQHTQQLKAQQNAIEKLKQQQNALKKDLKQLSEKKKPTGLRSGNSHQPLNAADVQRIQYAMLLIRHAVEAHWLKPSGTHASVQLQIETTQTGVVRHVSVHKSSGSSLFDDSAVAAVLKASPLPVPQERAFYEQYFRRFYITAE